MPMKECEFCHVAFEEKKALPAHERRCKLNPNRVVVGPAPTLTKEQIKTLVNDWGKRTVADFAELFNVPERSVNKAVKEIRKASGGKYCPVIRGVDLILRNRVLEAIEDL